MPPGDRDRGELADTMRIFERINAREVERIAAERRARETAAAQAQEERRQREAREARVKTGAALLDKSLAGTPGLGPWDRYVIRAAGVAALERSGSSEPIDAVIDEILRVQLRLHGPATTAPNAAAAATVPARSSAPVPAPPDDAEDQVDDNEPDDEEDDEVCDDPNCPECAAADAASARDGSGAGAGDSGWVGLALALGGIAVLAGAKLLADKRPPAPPTPPSTA
jgi:hypothetical protein